MHILFLTSTNLACNPRCRKEVELAIAAGYKVSVVAFDLGNWTDEKEKAIIKQLQGVNFYYLPAGRTPYKVWLKSVLIETLSCLAYKLGIRTNRIVASGVSRRTVLLTDFLKKKRPSVNFIIAHNPGAFYPAVNYASRCNIRYAIDVEDYHPGEGTDTLLHKMNEELLRRVLMEAAYTSYASESIMHKILTTIPEAANTQNMVINNVFPAKDFVEPVTSEEDNCLNLIWFSQNIDVSRGLEQLLPVLDEFQEKIKLTLIGNLNKIFFDKYLSNRAYINICPPLKQEDLHVKLSQYDIGFAIEPGKDINNGLALSNKIWTYLQAGLYIVASGTEAQSSFIKKFSEHGTISSLEFDSLKKTISILYENRKSIVRNKFYRWQKAQSVSWAAEADKLLTVWGKIDS